MRLGTLDPPLGKVRLFIVRLISESIPQKSKALFAAIKETQILSTIISLFFVSFELNGAVLMVFRNSTIIHS